MARTESPAPQTAKAAPAWIWRLIRNVLLWLVPVAALWMLLTPFYNRFLITSAGNLLKLGESPNVSRLLPADAHYVTISRDDFPPARSNVYRVRVTDLHFHLILLAALFLAVPDLSWRERLGSLGWACLIAVFFHIADLFLWVKFVYSTQLGTWSQENYSSLAQNVWGLAKHLTDLPFKLALPLALWMGFHYRRMIPGTAP